MGQHESAEPFTYDSPAEHAAIEVQLLMTEPEVAREVLRQLQEALGHTPTPTIEQLRADDAALHPWGEPGVVPDVPVDGSRIWYALSGDEPGRALILAEPTAHRPYTIWSEDEQDDMPEELVAVAQFRKRWTPEAP